jgi:hypothetical protein
VTLDAKQQATMDGLLQEAVANEDIARVKIYVSKGANVHVPVRTDQTIRMSGTYQSSGTAPLYHKMLEDSFNYPVSDFFFDQGVAVDVRNFKGNTPLMLSVKNGNFDRVKYFLSKGADPLAANDEGEIVLDEARKLRAYDCNDRQAIIDALVAAMGSPVPAKPAAPEKPAAEVETGHDIQTLKPIEFAPRKKAGGGFHL